MDQIPVQYHLSGARKSLHVDLARDEKVDSLAGEYYDSSTNSSVVAPNSRRNRPKLAQGSIKLGEDKVVSDQERLANHGGRGQIPPCDIRSKQALPVPSSHNGSEATASLDTESGRTVNVFGHDVCGKTSTLDGQQILANSFNRDCEVPIGTGKPTSSSSNLPNGIAKGDFMSLLSLTPTPVTLRARKCTFHWRGKYLNIKARNLWNKICGQREDHFSTLLMSTAKRPCYVSLERHHVIDRLALLTNPQSVNHKKLSFISRRGCLLSPNLMFKRNSRHDQAALQISEITSTSNPPEAPKLTSTVPCSTHTMSNSEQKIGCKRLIVEISRDPSLDHLALQDSLLLRKVSHSSNLSEANVRSSEATVTSTSESTHSAISQFAETLGRGRAWVQIERDSGLDKLVLQNSNLLSGSLSSNSPETIVSSNPPLHDLATPGFKKLLINIHRDSRVDQLALQHISSAKPVEDPGCLNPINPCHIKPRHQPTLKLSNSMTSNRSTRLPAEDVESLNDSYQARLGFLTNLDTHNAGISDSRRDIIKLRRISSGDWCVIQPEEPSLKTADPNCADVEMIVDDSSMMQPQSSNSGGSIPKSTRSRRPSAEHMMNSNIGQSPTLDSEQSQDRCCKKTCEVQLITDQSALHRFPSEQTVPEGRPVYGSSTRSSSKCMQQTVGLATSTKSTRQRTKLVSSKEETPTEKHHNENENPRVIFSFKDDRVPSPKVNVVKPLVLRRSCKIIVENLSSRPHTRATRRKDLNCYNLVKPSISQYTPVKKPLGQQSPNSLSM